MNENLLHQIDWCEVPGGAARVGTTEAAVDTYMSTITDLRVERDWLLKECPVHEVALQPFAISRNLVTNGLFETFAEDQGLEWKPMAGDEHPAVVDYDLAQQFTVWFSEQTGLPVRLPTEAEWEHAARGGDDRLYPWGDTFTPNHANMDQHSLGTTSPVGSYPKGASPFGVLDMAGNLEEWTASAYAPYSGAPDQVPAREDWALDQHVTRGGGWNHSRDLARCTRRHGIYSHTFVGFRLVTDDLRRALEQPEAVPA